MTRIRAAWMLIVLMMAGIGCSDKDSVPSGVLAKEDMQNILWDMIQADQYSTYLAKDSGRIDVKLENMRLYDQVFQLHHISREKFTKSYKYYMAHPELTQALMDSLLAMGNRQRNENYNRPVNRPVSTPPLTTVPAQTIPAAKTPAAIPAAKVPRPSNIPPSKSLVLKTPAQRVADSLRNLHKKRFEAP
jgi:hypothetical protein